MSNWQEEKSFDPNTTFFARWEWWSFADMAAAVKLTELHNANFRHVASIYEKYVAVKQAGDWHPSPQCIVISAEGFILDGFNRMKSDLLAGVNGRWYLTVRNWRQSEDLGIDRHKPRTIKQWFERNMPHLALNNHKISTLRWSILGFPVDQKRGGLVSETHMIMALEAMPDAYKLVFSSPEVTGFSAPVRAAFVRASAYTKEIGTALQIATTGKRDPLSLEARDESLMSLFRLVAARKFSAGGQKNQKEGYVKAEAALRGWINGEVLSKLYGFDREIFPVPALDAISNSLGTIEVTSKKKAA